MTTDLKLSRDSPCIAPRNPFTNFAIATENEDQYRADCLRTDRYIKDLLKRLLKSFSSACTILEVGCGTGHFTRWFDEQGLQPVGLDFSWPVLEQAKHYKSRFNLQGDALRLPFSSASFDLVALITTLEFLPNPRLALSEAIRTATQGLILVALNAHGPLSERYRCQEGSIWEVARLFTPVELRVLLRHVVGKNPRMLWQTTRPFWADSSPFVWGDFIGVAVRLQ